MRTFAILRVIAIPFLLAASAQAQTAAAPAWIWAATGGGATSSDYCRGAACDVAGNTFVTGDFYGSACTLGGGTYNSSGGSGDAYVVKYGADGTPAWVRTVGGAGTEVGVDIASDSQGSAILAGTYGSTPLVCGNNAGGQPVRVALPTGTARGVLLVKFDASGNTPWAVGFGGSGGAAGNEIATGPNDESLVVGPFAQDGGTSLTFPNNTTINKVGGDQDVFVAKFNSAGVFQWGFGLNGDGHEEGRGIAVNHAGQVLVCGEFDAHLTLGASPSTASYTSAGGPDIFVAKYGADGAYLWSRQFGGAGTDTARGIAAAPDGTIFVSGEFSGTVRFDAFTLTSAGAAADIFLLKLDVNGNVLWARSFGSPGVDQGCEIETDATGSVYCAGTAAAGLVFPGGATLPNVGQGDQFVAKFDGVGTLLWATGGGGPNSDTSFALGLDGQGRATVVGSYAGSAAYGPATISTGHGTSTDFYVARLGGAGVPVLGLDPPVFGGGNVQLTVRAPEKTPYAIQTSTDLTTWQDVLSDTVQLAGAQTQRVTMNPGEPRRFYRAVTPPSPLRVNPPTADLPVAGTMTFTAQAAGGVTWSVDENGGGSVTQAGVYTAPGSEGTFHVRATSSVDPTAYAEATVNVVAASAAELSNYARAAQYSDGVAGDAVLVLKNGALVYEHYNGSTTAASAHLLASGTKSFNAALFALAESEGVWTIDENVSRTITEWRQPSSYDPNGYKSQITIRQLLSLNSGLVDSDKYQAPMASTLDTYELAINESTVASSPGQACIYAPSNFQVLAAMFERKTGMDPELYLYDRLLGRLGFAVGELGLWTRDVRGKPQMAGGGYFTAREWSNYGKLWLRLGAWQDGGTLLNPATVNLATTYLDPAFYGYGLSWWLNRPTQGTYNPPMDNLPADGHGDGDQIASNAPTDMYMAAGTGKQRLYIIPSLNLVVVRFGHGTGGSYSDHTFLGNVLGTP